EAEAVGAELDAMQRKLADADLVTACWDAIERPPPPTGGADLSARWGRRWRTLPPEAIEMAAPHVRAALRFGPSRGEILALDPGAGATLEALAPRLAARGLLPRPRPTITIASTLADLHALAPATLDAAITCCALIHTGDPSAVIESLWRA